MIEIWSKEYPVKALCQLLGVPRSGYYAWRKRKPSPREVTNEQLSQQIRDAFVAHRSNYGCRRITAQLHQQGQQCNHKRVERLMRVNGWRGRTCPRRKVRTTQSAHDQPVAPNLLRGRPAPMKVDEVWVADITYVPTAEGWLFVAAVMDLYSRQILGWSVWDSLEAAGALQALARALHKRGYPSGVIHHSDRGIQYACQAYRAALASQHLLASMSKRHP